MAFKIKRKQNIKITRVVVKVVATVIGLYVGGQIMTQLGAVMNQTYSPFYQGLSLVGWTVGTVTNSSTTQGSCATNSAGGTSTINNCITAVNGSGILAVIGIIGIASIVTEFVEFSM